MSDSSTVSAGPPATHGKSFLEAFLGFFYPPVCQICSDGRATAAEGYVCESCRKPPRGIHWLDAPFCEKCGSPVEGNITGSFQCTNCAELDLKFDYARSAVELTDTVREIIHRYKYNQALWFEPFLTELLLQRALNQLAAENWDFVVPVPLHPVRKRERGFNQAERLSRHVADNLGIPVDDRIIERIDPTTSQTRLTRQQRSENVKRAFRYRSRQPLNGEKVIVIDDVLTTGATCSACARVLKANGAGKVVVWTVARGRLN